MFLVDHGFFQTRSRARDAISRGTVYVDGVKIDKAGYSISVESSISVEDPAQNYVSRAALKLLSGLEAFPIKTHNINALDLGISTGGFTQVLLEHGAAHIIGIDVGHDQLAPSLIGHPYLTLHEGLNARHLEAHHLDGKEIDLIVSDVSFISLKLALPPALSLVKKQAQAVLLVKPQFEVGRENIGKGGLIKDPELGLKTAHVIKDWLDAQKGWHAIDMIKSPIEGGNGNEEYLLFGEYHHE